MSVFVSTSFRLLALSNLRFVLYLSLWLVLASTLLYKITDGTLVTLVIHESSWLYFLIYGGVYLLSSICVYTLYLYLRDLHHYHRNKHLLDDPRIRIQAIIDILNSGKTSYHYLEELRPEYYRLALIEQNHPDSGKTLIDGSIVVILNYLGQYIHGSERKDFHSDIARKYHGKLLELCRIKYFNLVKQ